MRRDVLFVRSRPQIEPLEARRLFSGGAGGFVTEIDLVSDIPGRAANLDPQLKNPWGVSFAPGGPFWVSDNNAGVATLYDGTGASQPLVVNVPGGGGLAAGNPTAMIFNTDPNFQVRDGAGHSGPASFIMVGEDGAITGWSQSLNPNQAFIAVDNSAAGAVYKGAALGVARGKTELFVANFHSGNVEVYSDSFAPIATLPTAFHDKRIPAGFAPFNVQDVGNQLYVTYAKQDATGQNDVGGAGNGFVDVYSTTGKLLRRLQHGTFLDSPWGVTTAPRSWGRFAGDVLVGQFKSGNVDIFSRGGHFVGLLQGPAGQPVQIDDLWSLTPGSGAANSSPETIFFTAGINDEVDGLFGSLAFTPIVKPRVRGHAQNPPVATPAPGTPTPSPNPAPMPVPNPTPPVFPY